MNITFLGTGTSQGIPVIGCSCLTCTSTNPFDKRLRSSILISLNKKKIVIDAGPDFRQQMLNAKVKHLNAILITHEHRDHIAGLDDIRAFNYIDKKPMDIYAEPNIHKVIKREFLYVFKNASYPGIPQMNLISITEKPFFIDNIKIIPIRLMHHKLPVLGFRINNFAYLTDANKISENELKKLKNLKVLVINALHLEKHISHFNLYEALQIISKVTPQKAYITHISHLMGPYNTVLKLLPKQVHLAYDGLKITI